MDSDTHPRFEKGDVWFPDGDIVLVAVCGKIAFRFFQWILFDFSAVFRNLLSTPRPEESIVFDNCPVMFLPDTAKDTSAFLTALRAVSEDRAFVPLLKPSFAFVAAMLQLGTKYEVEDLRQDAISRIEEIFPQSLEDFRNSYTISDGAPDGESTVFRSASMSGFRPADSIATLYLAQTHDLPHIVPQIFYICAQLRLDILVDGWKDADGKHWLLSRDDLRRCLEGEKKLKKLAAAQSGFLMEPKASPHCRNKQRCRSSLRAFEKEHRDSIGAPEDAAALLDDGWILVWADLELCCRTCTNYFRKEYRNRRLEIWDQLPQIFGLP